jgi:heme exporter protein C
MMWARVTWEQWWNNDPKQTVALIGLLMYFAYFVLRNAIEDHEKKARISAVTNIIFFFIFIPIIYVVPRLTDSLHPGNGGNPGFNAYDLDAGLRLIFYPAVLGWILFCFWIAQTTARMLLIDSTMKLQQTDV